MNPPTDHNELTALVKTRWRRRQCPDSYHTRVTMADGTRYSVRVAFRERYPLGSQAYDVYVRTTPDTIEEPGQLVEKLRIQEPAA